VPLLRGGGQERNRRAGTENLAGIAGFAAAATACAVTEYTSVGELRDRLETVLAGEAIAVGAGTARLPNTSAIAMPGVPAETQIIALDLDGVMVSAGAACSSGKVGPSHVLAAMGIAPHIANATIRVSLGWSTTEADIAHFIDAWTALYRRTRRQAKAA
jgi:cysteine desulfurase